MIIYHNLIKGVFQYNLCPYMRIGQILNSFMTAVDIAHRDAHLSTCCSGQTSTRNMATITLNKNIAMRPQYKGE